MGFSLKTQKTVLGRCKFSQKRAVGITYYGYRYYDPKTGRWPSRDPLFEQGFWLTNNRKQDFVSGLHNKALPYGRDTIYSSLMELLRGVVLDYLEAELDYDAAREALQLMESNLYGFVDNEPIQSIDVFGLDRQIIGDITFKPSHPSLVLEDWKVVNGKYVSAGATEWNFGPRNLGWGIAGVLVPVPGTVWTTDPNAVDTESAHAKTSPCQDIAARRSLELVKKSPHAYNVLGYNCKAFVEQYFKSGLNAPGIGECCNPDGTFWKR